MDLIIALNLNSAFHTTRLAVPYMKGRKWGRIIQTASAHSLVASPFKSAYVTAKHGLAGFTKTIALELATLGITANCISPGYVWTPLVEGQIPDTMKARGMTREQVINDVLLAGQPTKAFVTPEQVAALALYLCGDAAAQITGANLSVDGGWTPPDPVSTGRTRTARGFGMRIQRLAPIVLLLAAACSRGGEAARPIAPVATDWRAVATEADRARLRGWRDAWVAGLARARRADGPAVAAQGALFEPDRALPGALPPAGDYRCRTFKLGAKGTGPRLCRLSLVRLPDRR